jgi:preprotein translocase subunit SecY
MDKNIETKTYPPLRFLQIDSLPIIVESTISLSMLRLGQLFEQSLTNGASSAARIFHSQLSLENIFNRRNDRKEVLRN